MTGLGTTLAMVAICSAAIAVPASASASASADRADWDPGVAKPTGTCASAGVKGDTVAPQSGHRMADGGAVYTYDINGSAATSYIAPHSWNIRTASDEELRQYGVPPRPQAASALTNWLQTYQAVQQSPSVLCVSHSFASVYGASRPDSSATTYANSTPWSGVVDPWSSAVTDVRGSFTQYSAGYCGCPGFPNSAVDWVGIGGYYDSALIQVGTDTDSQYSGASGTHTHGWYEYLSSPTDDSHIQPLGGDIQPGSAVTLDVHWWPATSTASYVQWTIWSNGHQVGSLTLGLNNYYIASDTAEWIDERPNICPATGTCYNPLANFGVLTWYNSYFVVGGKNLPVAEGGAIGVQMPEAFLKNNPPPGSTCSNQYVQAYAHNITTNGFTNTWCKSD